ncbi:MAG: alpha/beta fold hydrolase [Proteobacteria bacterium]|nr:alpha/beta fold hydrolase [Pseudomonadota bacterium]
MRYRFGNFELDAAQRELRRSGESVGVQPLVLELLLYLVCHRNRVVTKQELLDALWADSNVTEASLARAISLARRAIGDDDRRAPLIRTHPRVGYRFTGELREQADPPHPAAVRDDTSTVSSYAKAGPTHIAYQVVGRGPVDVVMVQGWTLSMQSLWDEPCASRFLRTLAESCRLILFDKRGTGLSDRVKDLPGLAQRMEDLSAVLDAVGSKSAFVVGVSEGAPMSILYAASHPERVRGLALLGGFARMKRDATQPFGWTDSDAKRLEEYIRGRWGEGASLAAAVASHAEEPSVREWAARAEQIGGSPGAALELWRMNQDIDVRDVLPVLDTPTLVVHAKDDPVIDVQHGRQLGEDIAGAEYCELEGRNHVPFYPPLCDPILSALGRWVSEARPPRNAERVLATCLLGDWPADTDGDVDRALHQRVAAHRGRLAKHASGSWCAVFDGPALAIRCALAIQHALVERRVRCVLHCSELECSTRPSGDGTEPTLYIDGPGARFAERMLASAAPGEVVVSRTLRELVTGSGLAFEPHPRSAADGEAEPQPLFRARLA